ncbi:sphingosine-1-phosphate lyase 1-like isoform X1 [Mya arenaria]|uniref:sphingosine-1-phosphate lyase 1-like isoform X1 n=1 Tax=Mya arenaria TaxID=6604 RepID=UPI0022E7939B|nr:sphingosine-1-phosphate lyase 1-like isoform X1 [Mya arenaria]
MEDVQRIAKDVVETVAPYLEDVRVKVNTSCSQLEGWQIIAYTFGLTLILVSIYNFLFDEEKSLKARVKKSFFKFVKNLPIVKGMIQKEVDKNAKGVQESFQNATGGMPYVVQLPKKGMSEQQIMKELDKYQAMVEIDWSKGNVSGAVYNGSNELTEIITKAYKKFAWTNPLHPDLFPDIRKMEAEVVRMCCTMFNGDDNSCGTVTSGGTESILLACLAYRNMAKERGIRYPEIIAPITVHAAFDKAADFFHMKLTHIPVDPKTCKVDVNKMRRAINKNTCMLVGSAPQFPHGSIDNLEAIGALGVRYNVPVHTDCCLGGFLVPFMEKAGFDVPIVDFRVPGVTSISADTHKYGFAPKGSSVILYRNTEYRRGQFFVQPDWPGGIYASPTLAGNRAGAIIASCWASMMHFGEDGYVETTRKIIETTRYIADKLSKIEGIYVLGKPDVSVVAIASNDFNIFRLSDAMNGLGYSLSALQFPSSIHLCVTLLHTKPGAADTFLNNVRTCAAKIMKDPNAKCGGIGAIYGMSQSIPDRSMVSQIVGLFLDACYNTKDPEDSDKKVQKTNGVH